MSFEDARAARVSVLRRPSSKWLSLEPLALTILRRLLRRFEAGALTIVLPSGKEVTHCGEQPGPHGLLRFHQWSFIRRVLLGGDIGFAEAYMSGDWSTPDLTVLLECLQRNEAALQDSWKGFSIKRLAGRFYHAARTNTRRGSRRNIAAHYDLGNDFYAGWLDAGMNYSSALYDSPSSTLEEAQIAKLDHAIALLNIEPGHHVLEIGCGWGALAERLTKRHSARVTGITLSPSQLAYGEARLREAGTADRTNLKLQDYRDTTGSYDAIVSIEMLEAAGEAYWPTYFAKLKSCLKPAGVAVLQAITIEEARFADYQCRPDFIQRYIFPGGMLPTASLIERHAEAAALTVRSKELFGESYARTLAEWQRRYLQASAPANARHLETERFRRMWHYYLAYCEVGFQTGVLNVGLYQLTHA